MSRSRLAGVVDLGSFRRRLVLSAAALSLLVAIGLILAVQLSLVGSVEDDGHDALEVSVVAGVVLFLVATGLAAWASRRALAPVAHMARTAESWSEHDLGQRFELGPPTNEITALGQTLDGLLERVERTIVAEQRLTSELAHELRTPLTTVQGTAELVAMRTDLDPELREDVADILESCRTMSATVTGLLELARAQSSARTEESCSVGAVLDALRTDPAAHAAVSMTGDLRLRVAMPAGLVLRAVAPVLDNAVRHADHVLVTAHLSGPRVVIAVSDDGPGVAAADAELIFHPGQTTGGGSGLGLALARRIARSVGGDVTLATTTGGAAFDIALPALQDVSPAET